MRLPLPKKAVDALINHAMKHPYFHLPGYMERYWIIAYKKMRKTRFTRFIFGDIAARVHHILRSDSDRHFHDHPWNFLTVILRGGYWEIKPKYDRSGIYQGTTRIWYGKGSVRFVTAKTWHRLEVPEGMTAWTLFITFRWKQRWGFLMNPDNKMHYQEYLNIEAGSQSDSESSQAKM